MTKEPGALMLDRLGERLAGEVIAPDDDRYEAARRVWNAAIDKRPAAIIRCATAGDVGATVMFAREHDLLLAVRGGGHSVAGKSTCDGGLVLDLSDMKRVHVDPDRRRARAEPGLRWSEFDRATQGYGLATTGGVVSHTGIAGLTLGGGVGWLAHAYGLSCDNLTAVDIVTADGTLRHASADEHADLFWGIRGAGSNFGVVTSFEYALHPVDTVVGGMVLYSLDDARDALRFYREYARQIPDAMATAAALLTAPNGAKAAAIVVCYYGPAGGAEPALEPLRRFRPPLADLIGPMPYTKMQTLLDAAMAPGQRSYWRSHLLTVIDDGLIDAALEYFREVPSPNSVVIWQQLGGAVKRTRRDATAFHHRDAEFDFVVLSLWPESAEDERNIGWTRRLGDATAAHSSGGVYVNNLGDDPHDRVRAAYGGNYERLAALKALYDPANVFCMNQNLRADAGNPMRSTSS